MGLIFWWILPLWLLAFGSFLAIYYLRKRRSGTTSALPIAHSGRLTNLPEYQLAVKRYRRMLRWGAVVLAATMLVVVVQSARPATVSIVTPAQESRDIMLCLDVSGSMLRVDTKLLDRFTTLVSQFRGQRFGLTIFNSSSVTVIPLNDNYQLTTAQLKRFSTAFTLQKGTDFTSLTSGALVGFASGTSLVSDGLTSCINHLGDNAQNRSQSVILATDNESNGKSIVTLKQAIALAKEHNVRVYAVDPGTISGPRAADHAQLKSSAEDTGGNYFQLNNNNSVAEIISAVSKQESEYFGGTSVVATADNPRPLLYVLAVMILLSLVVVWRLEL